MSSHFIAERVAADIASGKYDGKVVTRFPPEPNGYLHIGHAKSICLNFGLAADFNGVCHLRMDDTNPAAEDPEYVEAIQRDLRWLGFEWDAMFYASDYYQKLFDIAVRFIEAGKAYVDDLSEEQISEHRGTVTEVGKPSPFRDRSVAENLDLFKRMNTKEFAPGSKVLRAKCDLASPNMKMRDPLMYRIKDAPHYRTGETWRIYPFYDYAHCFSDAFEGITHSICTLEFENNRELYDWYLEQVTFEGAPKRMPEQIEFARLHLDYTQLSKRKLLELVKDKHVAGWDDPRMPTIAGLRRRGYTAEAIRRFCDMIGVAKANSVVDIGKLEFAVREDLNTRSGRLLCVLKPLKVTIDNYPEGKSEQIDAGNRKLPFGKTLLIEQDDFMETPTADFHRLAPGREVRLRFAYVIKCNEVIKRDGKVVELRCSYDADPARKVKGIVHWVSAEHAKDVEVRLYDRLFRSPEPSELSDLNPHSLQVVRGKIEPHGLTVNPSEHHQFERQGFFFVDPIDSKPGAPVFNRTVGLKDSFTPAAVVVAKPTEKTHQVVAPKAAVVLTPRGEGYVKNGVAPEEAALLAQDDALAAFFEQAGGTPSLATWIVNELLRELKSRALTELPFGPAALGALVRLIDDGTISRRAAKDVFEVMLRDGGDPGALVDKLGLKQMSDTGALETIVGAVVGENAEQVARYKAGETKLFGFLVGQVIKQSGGKANPQTVNSLLKKALK